MSSRRQITLAYEEEMFIAVCRVFRAAEEKVVSM